MRRRWGPYERDDNYRVTGRRVSRGNEMPRDGASVFEVVGAGFITLGPGSDHSCGTAWGCSVAASWNPHGYCGGVMDISEMERLRDCLDALIKDCKYRTKPSKETKGGQDDV